MSKIMKKMLLALMVVLLCAVPFVWGALTDSADNFRETFGNAYAWSGHPSKDKALKWAVSIEEGVRSLSAAGNGPSLFWNNCPWGEYRDGVGGMAYFTDLNGNQTLAANKAAVEIGDSVAGFTGATGGTTITMATDEPVGSAILSCTTDNETVGISILSGTNTVGNFVFTTGKKSWFEARVKGLTIGNDEFGMFVGFAEEVLLAEDGVIGDDDALTDKDYFGFHRLAADGDKFDTVFNTASGGTSPVTIQADAATGGADTYVKLGGYCDGTTITLYANGVALTTTTTLAATDFPDGEEMAFYIVMNNKGGNDEVCAVDWVRIAREY